jgi:hypothetical protein
MPCRFLQSAPPGDGVSISVEAALGTDCPANRSLLYQVDRTMEHRSRQEGVERPKGLYPVYCATVPLSRCVPFSNHLSHYSMKDRVVLLSLLDPTSDSTEIDTQPTRVRRGSSSTAHRQVFDSPRPSAIMRTCLPWPLSSTAITSTVSPS